MDKWLSKMKFKHLDEILSYVLYLEEVDKVAKYIRCQNLSIKMRHNTFLATLQK